MPAAAPGHLVRRAPQGGPTGPDELPVQHHNAHILVTVQNAGQGPGRAEQQHTQAVAPGAVGVGSAHHFNNYPAVQGHVPAHYLPYYGHFPVASAGALTAPGHPGVVYQSLPRFSAAASALELVSSSPLGVGAGTLLGTTGPLYASPGRPASSLAQQLADVTAAAQDAVAATAAEAATTTPAATTPAPTTTPVPPSETTAVGDQDKDAEVAPKTTYSFGRADSNSRLNLTANVEVTASLEDKDVTTPPAPTAATQQSSPATNVATEAKDLNETPPTQPSPANPSGPANRDGPTGVAGPGPLPPPYPFHPHGAAGAYPTGVPLGGYRPPDFRFRGDPYHGDPFRGDPYRGDPYRADPYRGDPYRADPYSGDPYRADPYRGDPYRGDPYRGDPRFNYASSQQKTTSKPGTNQANPTSPNPNHFNPLLGGYVPGFAPGYPIGGPSGPSATGEQRPFPGHPGAFPGHPAAFGASYGPYGAYGPHPALGGQAGRAGGSAGSSGGSSSGGATGSRESSEEASDSGERRPVPARLQAPGEGGRGAGGPSLPYQQRPFSGFPGQLAQLGQPAPFQAPTAAAGAGFPANSFYQPSVSAPGSGPGVGPVGPSASAAGFFSPDDFLGRQAGLQGLYPGQPGGRGQSTPRQQHPLFSPQPGVIGNGGSSLFAPQQPFAYNNHPLFYPGTGSAAGRTDGELESRQSQVAQYAADAADVEVPASALVSAKVDVKPDAGITDLLSSVVTSLGAASAEHTVQRRSDSGNRVGFYGTDR